MKMKRHMVMVVAALLALSACTAVSKDQRYRKMIVGSWIMAANSSDYIPVPMREVFLPSGQYRFYVYSDASCSHVTATVDTTWKIKNGVLITRVTYASNPRLGPVGSVMRDKIISITRTRMALHSLDDGTTYSRTRSKGCLAEPKNHSGGLLT